MGDNDSGVDWAADLQVPEDFARPVSQLATSDALHSAPPEPVLLQQVPALSECRPAPAAESPVTSNRKRTVLIASAGLTALALLAVAGVVATRPGAEPESAAAPGYGPCDRLGPDLPAKAQGLPLDTDPIGAHGRQCVWHAQDPTVVSTWSLTVMYLVESDTSAAQSRFDRWRKTLEDPSIYNVRTTPLPGVEDEALAGTVPNGDYLFGARPGEPMRRIDLHRFAQPGVVTLVRAHDAVVEVQWSGADYPPGTHSADRDHVTGTPLPPEQAQREAVGVAESLVRLLRN